MLIPPLRLKGERHIEVGARVVIGAHSWLQVIDHGPVPSGPVITIGDRLSAAGFLTVTAVERVVIESNVLMARHVYISDHSHESGTRTIPIRDQGITNIKPVRICEGAWLGQNVVICPGVTIGKNAVVGANSVVRQDVPDYSLAVGAPARIVRRG